MFTNITRMQRINCSLLDTIISFQGSFEVLYQTQGSGTQCALITYEELNKQSSGCWIERGADIR